jgi:hypothetical protein
VAPFFAQLDLQNELGAGDGIAALTRFDTALLRGTRSSGSATGTSVTGHRWRSASRRRESSTLSATT